MNEKLNPFRNRRSFLKAGLTAAGATVGTGLLLHGTKALAQSSSSLTAGDAAILRFLAAGEALEADFWTQYNELGGIQDDELPGGSWWTRYRSRTNNPDVNPATFEQAVPDLHNGQFTAIPRTDADLHPTAHIQAIANTAAFHMPTVEQGGGSLRLALAQRITNVEVLQIVISMAPIESMHFQTWHEKAGNAPSLIDPTNNLTFPNLNNGVDPNTGASGAGVKEMFQTNLIMPEPCPFINASLPACSVVRPTKTAGAATGALNFLTAMGLFIGQSNAFFTYMTGLAQAADAAQRGM